MILVLWLEGMSGAKNHRSFVLILSSDSALPLRSAYVWTEKLKGSSNARNRAGFPLISTTYVKIRQAQEKIMRHGDLSSMR